MLRCEDIVAVKDEKRLLGEPVPFQRIYFEYADTDPVKDFDRESNSIEKDGSKKSYTSTVKIPAEDKTAGDPNALVAEAVAFFQGHANYSDKNPWLVLLEFASKGFDPEVRNEIRDLRKKEYGIAPKIAAKDPGKALESAAKQLVAGGMFPDVAAALVFLQGAKKAA